MEEMALPSISYRVTRRSSQRREDASTPYAPSLVAYDEGGRHKMVREVFDLYAVSESPTEAGDYTDRADESRLLGSCHDRSRRSE